MLKGKRTILAGLTMVGYAVASYFMGDLDLTTMIQRGIEGLAIVFLRLGLTK